MAEQAGDVYAKLSEAFDVTFKDVRGGVELEYITGEQAVTRLNETLGVGGWNFRIIEHGIHPEADECWCLAEITATFGETTVTRQQFGSQKIKRSRTSGAPLDIGFDLKGAATDALKKCATLLGVGLWLSRKSGGVPASDPAAVDEALSGNGETPAAGPLNCEECGEALATTNFKDGSQWTPAQLAGFGRRKHQRVLCMNCYRSANAAKRRAEEAVGGAL
jgi:hypothetical protein